MEGGSKNSGKPMCPICFEDLTPINEHLLTISICGHVFHELCLQKWFEYCQGKKKKSCPVCKQGFISGNLTKLYFQSVGDYEKSPQRGGNGDDDPALFRDEIRKLKGQVEGVNSLLGRHEKKINELTHALDTCKDALKKEKKLKNNALELQAELQQQLAKKSQELDIMKLEGLKMQDRNMSLAKELAAIKLFSDVELEEDDILKLASFGNEINYKETLHVLKKSLFLRNKSYKELMAKCNLLGRKESRTYKKLENAKEKISLLKATISQHQLHGKVDTKIDKANLNISINQCANPVVTNTSNKLNSEASLDGLNLDINGQTEVVINIKKEPNASNHPKKGDEWFFNGFLGPDEVKGYLGKMCKREQRSPLNMQGSSSKSGDLIAVGSDGRGGRIKVLKTVLQTPSADSATFVSSKKSKLGGKSASVQPQGNLQIEHFFTKSAPSKMRAENA